MVSDDTESADGWPGPVGIMLIFMTSTIAAVTVGGLVWLGTSRVLVDGTGKAVPVLVAVFVAGPIFWALVESLRRHIK